MYCPKCGCENQSTANQCENCGFLFYTKESESQKNELPESVLKTESNNVISEPFVKAEPRYIVQVKPLVSKEQILGMVLFGIAAIVFVLSLIGSVFIFHGGAEIAEIQSVGGKTLEEAYYYRLQSVYTGYGFGVLTLGTFCSTVLTAFGFFFCWKQPSEHQK